MRGLRRRELYCLYVTRMLCVGPCDHVGSYESMRVGSGVCHVIHQGMVTWPSRQLPRGRFRQSGHVAATGRRLTAQGSLLSINTISYGITVHTYAEYPTNGELMWSRTPAGTYQRE